MEPVFALKIDGCIVNGSLNVVKKINIKQLFLPFKKVNEIILPDILRDEKPVCSGKRGCCKRRLQPDW
jgi:hypothetical protein